MLNPQLKIHNSQLKIMLFSRFDTEMQVRPDDIDMNQHVHNSKYNDYVLAARYDQMELFYKFPMEKFLENKFAWVINKAIVEYKRPLGLGDRFIVNTGIKEMLPKDVSLISISPVNVQANYAVMGNFIIPWSMLKLVEAN